MAEHLLQVVYYPLEEGQRAFNQPMKEPIHKIHKSSEYKEERATFVRKCTCSVSQGGYSISLSW